MSPGQANDSISGTQFIGLTQATAYGDDLQNATNYPLVRIVHANSGHVFYCKTHNPSSMGVATGSALVSTQFDVNADIELGLGKLYVVANGIPSAPPRISVHSNARTRPSPRKIQPAWEMLYSEDGRRSFPRTLVRLR